MCTHVECMNSAIHVVDFDAVQMSIAQSKKAADGKPKARRAKVKKQTRTKNIISAPRSDALVPTSVRLAPSYLDALKAHKAQHGTRSISEIIQRAIRDYVFNNGSCSAPKSLGVVDGVYGATIHDDVVELANLLRRLEFSLLKVTDLLPTSNESKEIKDRLTDASIALDGIAGRIVYKGMTKRKPNQKNRGGV